MDPDAWHSGKCDFVFNVSAWGDALWTEMYVSWNSMVRAVLSPLPMQSLIAAEAVVAVKPRERKLERKDVDRRHRHSPSI